MNHWLLKTPEERKAIARKSIATKQKNKEAEKNRRQDAITYRDGLWESIQRLEKQLASLENLHTFSSAIKSVGKKLLSQQQIVDASEPWEEQTGVYFLISESSVVYVGQSTNVYSRIQMHVDKKFDRVTCIKCDKSELDKFESLYIHMLRPILNKEQPSGMKIAPISLQQLIEMK
jgi:hypothetical protein